MSFVCCLQEIFLTHEHGHVYVGIGGDMQLNSWFQSEHCRVRTRIVPSEVGVIDARHTKNEGWGVAQHKRFDKFIQSGLIFWRSARDAR